MFTNTNLSFIKDPSLRKAMNEFLHHLKIYSKAKVEFSTPFYNPVEIDMALSLASDLEILTFGAREQCEREIIYTAGLELEDLVSVVVISSDVNLSHSHVLGSLLGLGLGREELGDIVIDEGRAEVLVLNQAKNNIIYGLSHVGQNPVKLEIKDTLVLQETSGNDIEGSGTVSSMRLDGVLAVMLNTSRAKAQEVIRRGRVKLNHLDEARPGREVESGDVISVRGVGRFILKRKRGKSRKGRTFIDFIKKG